MRSVVSLSLLGFLVCLSLLTTGCATIFHGSSQTISISTDPPEALAKAGGNTYKTPAQAVLRRDADYIITVEKDGYETSQGTITHSVHWPTFLGNIILGGLIGWAIDFSSGSAYALEPENLIIPMKPKGSKLSNNELMDTPQFTVNRENNPACASVVNLVSIESDPIRVCLQEQ